MKIIIDAMGGDNAPEEIVKGAVRAKRELGVEVCLVGRIENVKACLEKEGCAEGEFEIVDAREVVTMEDDPSTATRRKKDSSMTVALNLLRDGKGDAVVSAGSTGAPAPKAVKPAGDGQGTVSGEKKRSRHRPRRRSGGNKPNGGTEA